MLLNETVKDYGSERMIKEYDYGSIRFIDKIKDLDAYSLEELKNT